MSIFRDKQIKWFCFFIVIYAALIFGTAIWFSQNQIAAAKSMYLEHDSAIVSSLLEQGVSEEVIANAISSTEANNAGIKLLSDFGIGKNTMGTLLPHFSQFQYHSLSMSLFVCIFLIVILFIGVISFLLVRNQLYRQAGNIINNYISHDVMDMLISASRRFQQTILMITHNNNLTASVDRVFRVSDGILTDLGGTANETLS